MKKRSKRARGAGLRSLGCVTPVTLVLLLGGCSQSSDLLTSLKTPPTETASSDASTGPQSDLQKATQYWGDEYAKKPSSLQPALNYARNLKAMGEKKKAMAVLQQASLLHGDSKELAGEFGRLAVDLDQIGAAAQALAAADDPAKPDWKILSARGTVFAKQGKYGEAIPYYERALAVSENNPTVMNNLAMAYAMMGDAKKAEGLLRDASNSDKATPKMRENLALVLGLQGRYDESRSIASGASSSGVADVDYLKKMVKAPAIAADPAPVTVAQQAAKPPAPLSSSPEPAKTVADVPQDWMMQSAMPPATPNAPGLPAPTSVADAGQGSEIAKTVWETSTESAVDDAEPAPGKTASMN